MPPFSEYKKFQKYRDRSSIIELKKKGERYIKTNVKKCVVRSRPINSKMIYKLKNWSEWFETVRIDIFNVFDQRNGKEGVKLRATAMRRRKTCLC